MHINRLCQGTFVAVTGTFVVPTPSAPDGAVSVLVGIDGYTCDNAILQTGVDISYESGDVSFQRELFHTHQTGVL